MRLPTARGPFSRSILELLRRPPEKEAPGTFALVEQLADHSLDPHEILEDEDLRLVLFCLYELHYGGLQGADERWEWNPGLIAARQEIEAVFEAALRGAVVLPALEAKNSDSVAAALFDLTAAETGPSMSRYIAKTVTVEQFREFMVHKSIYQLKEADPHTWAIPRLTGRAKAALVEIQADEYGSGRQDQIHSAVFTRTMRGLGLSDSYGAHVEVAPALTLSSTNMMPLFGPNRRLRGAIVGHLAAYEMTSSQPNRRYGNGLRRHGFGQAVTRYFDEHVEADAVHEQIAGRDLAGGLLETEPHLLEDIYFGACAVLALDAMSTTRIFAAWESGTSSLLVPLTLSS